MASRLPERTMSLVPHLQTHDNTKWMHASMCVISPAALRQDGWTLRDVRSCFIHMLTIMYMFCMDIGSKIVHSLLVTMIPPHGESHCLGALGR